MGKIVPIVVTGYSRNRNNYENYSTPVVLYVNDEDLKISPALAQGGLALIEEFRVGGHQFAYKTPLKPEDFEVLRNPATTDYALVGRKQVAQAANGTNQSTTLTLKQYNEITTGTAASAEACKLPVDPALNDVVCVINNHATMTLKVFPGVGDSINALAVNTAYDVLPGKRVFFVCTTAGSLWKTAIDYGR